MSIEIWSGRSNMALSFGVQLFKSQYLSTIPYPTHDFTGQIAIVTGANTGLGLEAARHLTRLNAAKVIIACRTVSKGEVAKKSIEDSTKRQGVVEVWQLDLNSYTSVKDFAARAEQLDRLDVLLENAGVNTLKWSIAEDNETTITTNVVSTILLGLLLLPKLKETESRLGIAPRLVIVSSDTHEMTNLPERNSTNGIFNLLNDRSKANMKMRYPNSKLLEILTVREMVRKHAPDGYPVVINYVNPGFCQSELMRETEMIKKIMYPLLRARTSEVGSRVLVHAASSGKESHGKFISNSQIQEPSQWVRSEEGRRTGEKVWQELIIKLEKIKPAILTKL
jgi:retinol dehydrogenase-12